MSFIYENKKLVELLKQAGQQFAIKYGQEAAPVTDPNAYAVGAQLLSKLQREIDPKSAPADTSTVGAEGGGQPTLSAQNINSLPDFLQWCSDNKVTWQGKRVAWTTDPTTLVRPEGVPDDAWVFRNKTKGAYASKAELIGLLSHLRDSDEARGNRVFQSGMSKIINEANQTLTAENEKGIDANPAPKADKPAAAQNGLDPNMVVDAFGANYINGVDPFYNITKFPFVGNLDGKVLTVKDISSSGAFLAWLKSMQINTKAGVKPIVDPNADPCEAIRILYKRAKWISQYAAIVEAGAPGYSKAVALYLQNIPQFGGQLTGPDGKPCSIDGVAVAPAGNSANPAVTTVNLARVIDTVPLRTRDINFQRITDFFDQYKKVLGTNDAGAQTAMNHVNTAMSNIKSNKYLINPDMNIFSLTSRPEDIMNLFQPGTNTKTGGFMFLIDNLISILDNTEYVMRDLQDRYDNTLDEHAKNLLVQQIGAGLGSGSVYAMNKEQLRRLRTAVMP